MAKRVIVLNQNGEVHTEDLPKSELDFLQTSVGGWVQVVDLAGAYEGIALWVNEEGKFDTSLTLNKGATFIWEQSYGVGTDFIMGNAVFTGVADSNGVTKGLTSEQQAFLMSSFLLAEVVASMS